MDKKSTAPSMQPAVEAIYHREASRVLATLIRLLNGNFDLAEDALQDAFIAALDQWPDAGIPENPRAWLISTGRFRAIDRLRKQTRSERHEAELIAELEHQEPFVFPDQDESIEDDRLRLIFTCCHPSLAMEARTALTLREVCGLTTEQIAAAFLIPVPTLAQRIVRARNKIRDAGIPYEVPDRTLLPARLSGVLQVIYLVFNEGYSASSGDSLLTRELCAEAIRLGQLLLQLIDEPEVRGLLGLMLLHDARGDARTDSAGDLVSLEDQDRSHWNRNQIAEGCTQVVTALRDGPLGFYALQAAIAAVHAEAPEAAATDWQQIVGLYDVLMLRHPSPVIALNRAAAIAMRDGPESGLKLIEELLAAGELEHFYLAHAARADLLRRLGNTCDAEAAYQSALALTRQAPERRFLQRRLDELKKN